MEINQYQVIIVNLDPTVGSEIKKTRPCVVISPNEMNKYIRTIVIAPITSKSKKYPTRIKINPEGNENWVVLDQIRTVDKIRAIKQIGFLSNSEIRAIKNIIRETYVD